MIGGREKLVSCALLVGNISTHVTPPPGTCPNLCVAGTRQPQPLGSGISTFPPFLQPRVSKSDLNPQVLCSATQPAMCLVTSTQPQSPALNRCQRFVPCPDPDSHRWHSKHSDSHHLALTVITILPLLLHLFLCLW